RSAGDRSPEGRSASLVKKTRNESASGGRTWAILPRFLPPGRRRQQAADGDRATAARFRLGGHQSANLAAVSVLETGIRTENRGRQRAWGRAASRLPRLPAPAGVEAAGRKSLGAVVS